MKKILYILLLIALLLPTSSVFAANAQPRIWGEPEFFDHRDIPAVTPVVDVPDLEVYQYDTTDPYSCRFVTQQPPDDTVLKPRQSFDMNWTVVNNGSAVWHAGSTMFAFYSGTPTYTHEAAYALTETVGLGEKLHIRVDMEAPKNPGVYSTTWAILTGNTRICRVFFSFTVK